jgi:hypothetical protein
MSATHARAITLKSPKTRWCAIFFMQAERGAHHRRYTLHAA